MTMVAVEYMGGRNSKFNYVPKDAEDGSLAKAETEGRFIPDALFTFEDGSKGYQVCRREDRLPFSTFGGPPTLSEKQAETLWNLTKNPSTRYGAALGIQASNPDQAKSTDNADQSGFSVKERFATKEDRSKFFSHLGLDYPIKTHDVGPIRYFNVSWVNGERQLTEVFHPEMPDETA